MRSPLIYVLDMQRTAKRDLRHRIVAPEKPRLRTPQVRKAIREAVRDGQLVYARLFAVARHFMPRLLPLQLDGRAGLPRTDTRWHPQVLFPDDRTGIIRLKKAQER